MKRSLKIFLTIDIILLALIGCLYFYRIKTRGPVQVHSANQNAVSQSPAPELDHSAGDYVSPTPDSQPDDGIAIPGWGTIELPAGQTDVSVYFPNPEANADRFYLTFELRLKETGEVLFASGLVPPGKVIQNITLSRPLEAGTYLAEIHVQPYRMDAATTPTNNADMETELIVK